MKLRKVGYKANSTFERDAIISKLNEMGVKTEPVAHKRDLYLVPGCDPTSIGAYYFSKTSIEAHKLQGYTYYDTPEEFLSNVIEKDFSDLVFFDCNGDYEKALDLCAKIGKITHDGYMKDWPVVIGVDVNKEIWIHNHPCTEVRDCFASTEEEFLDAARKLIPKKWAGLKPGDKVLVEVADVDMKDDALPVRIKASDPAFKHGFWIGPDDFELCNPTS